MRAIEPCLGIQVIYDPLLGAISDSRGVWRWKKIVVGRQFFGFPPREQGAILLHEAGHCKLGHVARLQFFIARSPRRLLKLLFFSIRSSFAGDGVRAFHAALALALPDLAEYRKKQELQADRYAAGCGYGHDLARALARMHGDDSGFYPPRAERILRLLAQS